MKSKKDVKNIIKILKETYPEAECSLDFSNPFQMAIAVLLSAQCTDARVNIVTKELFKIAPNAKEMNKLTVEEIEKYISSCGLYKTKAKNIKKLAEKSSVLKTSLYISEISLLYFSISSKVNNLIIRPPNNSKSILYFLIILANFL